MNESMADIFGHISNLIYLVGSIIKGSLAVRVSWVLGAIGELLYYVYIASEPLWTSIIWCLIITGLNLYQIILILLSRRKGGLSSREQTLYKLLFSAMDITNFRKIMKKASWDVLNTDRVVITENEPTDSLFLLSAGIADVVLSGKPLAQIEAGSFIGEMGLLTGQVPAATVKVRAGATLISWKKNDIDKLQQSDEGLNNELYAVFSRDIIEKIKQQNRQVAAEPTGSLAATASLST